MFNRYELSASFKGKRVFTGQFMSLNKAIKTACFFDSDIVFFMYDYLTEKSYSSSVVWNFVEEFKNGEIYI